MGGTMIIVLVNTAKYRKEMISTAIDVISKKLCGIPTLPR